MESRRHSANASSVSERHEVTLFFAGGVEETTERFPFINAVKWRVVILRFVHLCFDFTGGEVGNDWKVFRLAQGDEKARLGDRRVEVEVCNLRNLFSRIEPDAELLYYEFTSIPVLPGMLLIDLSSEESFE